MDAALMLRSRHTGSAVAAPNLQCRGLLRDDAEAGRDGGRLVGLGRPLAGLSRQRRPA